MPLRKTRSVAISVSSLCSELARPASESTSNSSSIRSEQSAISRIIRGSKLYRLVVGAAVAVVLLETAARRVLHVRDDERAAVEAGQVQEPTLVHAGSIRDAHRMTSFRSLG